MFSQTWARRLAARHDGRVPGLPTREARIGHGYLRYRRGARAGSTLSDGQKLGWYSDPILFGAILSIGLAIFAWSSYLTANVDINTTFWTLAWWTVLSRIGLGLVFPALSAGSLSVLPRGLIAQGSGAMNFTRQLGGAFGVNLLTVVLERRAMFHSDVLAATQTPDNPAVLGLISQVGGLMGHLGLPSLQQTPAALWFLGQAVYAQASTLAYRDGFLITAIVFGVALVPTFLLERARRKAAPA